jgi:hypothetical protein
MGLIPISPTYQLHFSGESWTSITELLDDAQRTIAEFWTPVACNALQVYHSAVLFMPHSRLYDMTQGSVGSIGQLLSARQPKWGIQASP